MPQLAAAIEAFPPDALARMERGAGAADLRRLQRPVFPESVEGIAAAARLVAAARRDGRAIRTAPPLDRLGREAAVCCFRRPTDKAPSMRDATVLALGGASWPRLGSDGGWVETLARQGRDDIAAQARQLRLRGRLVGYLPRSLRGRAAEGDRAVVRRAQRPRRSDDHPQRHRGRRDLCALGRIARGHPRFRARRPCTSRLRPDLDDAAI